MQLLPIEIIKINQSKIDKIDRILKAVLRLVIFSRYHKADDVLDIYLNSLINIKQLVALKNAQMEAQNEEEAQEYLTNLKASLEFITDEINDQIDFENEIQLFQLLRLISPETNAIHPNKYRQTEVIVGQHSCPQPNVIPSLMSELFYNINTISNPIIRSIYLHHEMIRIHPFADGNGRVTRIAKNWMLMFELYPPIFIEEITQKKDYINALSNSFKALDKEPTLWNDHTNLFFEQQLDILLTSTSLLLESIDKIGLHRITKKNN
ncbi:MULTISPECIES: Fic family protein [unclassified Flavobacterium]|uniref:Fic family protein n=1 Tax=unclassified Flavobacterium TaxID=196869 RepID=UPI00131B94E3|nr:MULTISPECIES: Fic family protein [unclassified Flavobacterium]